MPALKSTTTKPQQSKSRPVSKIVPHLWFDNQAGEAAEFYATLFPESRITNRTTLRDTPSGDAEVVSFELAGQSFMAISAGPLFKFNPSTSFLLNFDPSRDKDARKSLDKTWARLEKGGKVLMELQEYPFSKRYGWLEDKYGVNWQFILTNPEGEPRPFIIPSLMFTGKVAGRAEEALRFYASVFKDSKVGNLAHHPKGSPHDKEGTLMFGEAKIEGQWFAATDSAYPHGFAFNEAISFMVNCEDQAEIDYYWKKLSADPKAEQCGWLKDKFGVSWQVVPRDMGKMMQEGNKAQIAAVTQAFLPMKKFDLAKLRQAYESAGRKPTKSA